MEASPKSIPHPRVEAARSGSDPALICKMPSGWVSLCTLQFLRGYCILYADPVVESINAIDSAKRAQFLTDMVIVGDALLEVTGASRINYWIAGNSDPVLHAHIVPRYSTEPEELRKGLPWSHLEVEDKRTFFNLERDEQLIRELRAAIQKRL